MLVMGVLPKWFCGGSKCRSLSRGVLLNVPDPIAPKVQHMLPLHLYYVARVEKTLHNMIIINKNESVKGENGKKVRK